MSDKSPRIVGFDIARAYAIFGMFIVNFNFCFGALGDSSPAGRFLALFVGNSTAIFIVLAGMGVSLMSSRDNYSAAEKKKLRSTVLKRSWFLFALGLLLYNWWPGDILHFYGGYMHIAAFLLFVPKKYFLWAAAICIALYHVLLLIIPVEAGWDLQTYNYVDFWTPLGFLRNTIYNGWNSMFPWMAYFLLGMWFGRQDWQSKRFKRGVFITGMVFFLLFQLLRMVAKNGVFPEFWTFYIMSEYIPPYLPFMVITAGFACMVIPICMYLGARFSGAKWTQWLALTGRMTLSHYVIHLTLGMVLFATLSGKTYGGLLEDEMPTAPLHILIFSIFFFAMSVVFSFFWSKWYKNGPLESIMRKISG
jgi:uncharacterized protein